MAAPGRGPGSRTSACADERQRTHGNINAIKVLLDRCIIIERSPFENLVQDTILIDATKRSSRRIAKTSREFSEPFQQFDRWLGDDRIIVEPPAGCLTTIDRTTFASSHRIVALLLDDDRNVCSCWGGKGVAERRSLVELTKARTSAVRGARARRSARSGRGQAQERRGTITSLSHRARSRVPQSRRSRTVRSAGC